MLTYFYDIESLQNVFTLANYRAQDKVVEMYYLIDNPGTLIPCAMDRFRKEAADAIRKQNRNFRGNVEFYDLAEPESVRKMAMTFGMSDARYANNKARKSSYPAEFRLVCDTDPEYDDEVHPYLMGYNSFNYDTTMLVLFLKDVVEPKTGKVVSGMTAQAMRFYNDQLFTAKFKDCMPDFLKYELKDPGRPPRDDRDYVGPNYSSPGFIMRKNMLMSGRHLDVARLNEKQSMVGLKRLLGMLGYQIKESDKLRPGQSVIETYEQLLDLFAYNVSDVVNLEKLFLHKTYRSAFLLKRQMLKTYPELVYEEKKGPDGRGLYKPDVGPEHVRNDRMTIDSSSAQLSTKTLCPYGCLHDIDHVSFLFPAKEMAEELGVPQVNVLEETRKFFYANFPQPELRARFDEIYDYYKAIEGKNFNAGKVYAEDHGVDPDDATDALPEEFRVWKLSEIPAPNTCLFYYNKDGTPSTCFVNFSTGGIHGAECNVRLYELDRAEYEKAMEAYNGKVDRLQRVMAMYPDPRDLKKAKGVELDGVRYRASEFLKPKATLQEAHYKDVSSITVPKEPQLFQPSVSKATGATTYGLAKRYTYTSFDPVNHEDFSSYYPSLLRLMRAFYNEGLGYDRYGEVYENKNKYGKLMKDKSLSQDERDLYALMRNGTKLILNSASGAADANFESAIRMNNQIISMRIIGQLFSWRIGQAQTLEGGKATSTNTDGLYVALEEELNNRILEREASHIHVQIDPEPMYLISKDSNNRAEIKMDGNQLTEIMGASGGSLACRKGPNPEKSLAHPAIVDWALCEYLVLAAVGYKGVGMDKPFDDELGMSILKSARKVFDDDVQTLMMFQNIIASSPGSQRYVFATTDEDPMTPIPLQHYNRCFVVKDVPGAVHLKAAHAKVITEAMRNNRQKLNERPQQHDPVAAAILAVNGLPVGDIAYNKEATVVKIPGVEDLWNILIENGDLHEMGQNEIDAIIDSLDMDNYLSLLHDAFENNWRNMTPESVLAEREAAAAAKDRKGVVLFDLNAGPDPDVELARKAVAAMEPEGDNTAPVPVPEPPDVRPDAADGSATANWFADAPQPAGGLLDGIDPPRMVVLKKTVLSQQDLYAGEKQLCMGGVRQVDAHRVLAKLLLAMTDTDIG